MSLTRDPAWPWSISGIGLPALALVALLLAGLTIWTYLGVGGATFRRVSLVLGLRLLALILAVLTVLRPSLAFQDELDTPSFLLLAVDGSESMTIQDEYGGQSRWSALQRTLRDGQGALHRLREDHHVQVMLFRFAGDVREFDPDSAGQADGRRSDYAELLRWLYERYRTERFLRGLVVLGDGAHNGAGDNPLALAPQWRNLPCPIYTVGFGKTTTSEKQLDIAVNSITVEPAQVRVKGEMTVRASIDAPGFENANVNLRLLLDDKVVASKPEVLRLTTGNQVQIKCNAPGTPCEVKVTLRVDPLPNETITSNNEMTTYVNVSQEGLSVLLVDKERFPEPQSIARVLRNEPRIRLYDVTFRGGTPVAAGQMDLFQFDKQHYDVIILGDVSTARLKSGNPEALKIIKQLVQDKGVGLMMMGGTDSFGGSDWQGTEIAELLPVELSNEPPMDREVRLAPLEPGLKYLLRLGDDDKSSRAKWKELRPLSGMNRLGRVRQGAEVYATAVAGPQDDPRSGEPLLVGRDFNKGRVLAFAGDTTYRWITPQVGPQPHANFWKRVVLWLAHQEQMEGSVWIKPDTRRLPAGGKLPFLVGLRGKAGEDRPGEFTVKVIDPNKNEMAVPVIHDKNEDKGTFWKTETAGEYRIEVNGKGKDADGNEIRGTASARFIVYEDDAEMKQRAANHDFLKALATAGGGEFLTPDALAGYLAQLQSQPLAHSRPKANLWPDWRRSQTSGFLAGFFLLFVAVLSLEWFLRRRWGLV
jgi:uncharacterized membrane protein